MGLVVEVILAYLQTNRRLVVPGFGAFMVKESGERIFSDLLRTDDGVLFSLLRAKGLSEMEAAVVSDRFVFEVRHELEQYGYCRLGELGTLRLEPTTKSLRLYPPIQGEMPKQTPYIPKPVAETENKEQRTENKEQVVKNAEPLAHSNDASIANVSNASNGANNQTAPAASVAHSAPKKTVKPRKKFDFVMVVAVIILVAALLGIGYGWYVSNLGVVDDDAAMDALRVTPGLINE